MSINHNFWRERRAEAVSNRGSSAYQPNALPLGHIPPSHSLHLCLSVCLSVSTPYLSVCQSLSVPHSISLCLSVSICLSLPPYITLSVSVSHSLHICLLLSFLPDLSPCLSLSLTPSIPLCLSLSLTQYNIYICLSLSLSHSISLCVCLSPSLYLSLCLSLPLSLFVLVWPSRLTGRYKSVMYLALRPSLWADPERLTGRQNPTTNWLTCRQRQPLEAWGLKFICVI